MYVSRVMVPVEARGVGVTGGCEPPAVGPGEPNSGPLKEQYVSLTAESSLSLKSNS